MRRRFRLAALPALAALLAIATDVGAVSCSVSTAGLAFGAYDLLSRTPLDSTVTVTTSCTIEPSDGSAQRVVPIVVALSAGSSGSFVQRRMQSGAERLLYNVYTSNTYANPWGDGAGSSDTQSAAFTLNQGNPTRTRTFTGWGRVPPQQDVAAGQYVDNLVVTVTF